MANAANHCCLCGLLCSLQQSATPHTLSHDVAQCPRRQSWLSGASSQGKPATRPWIDDIPGIAALFSQDRKPLIWLDAVDVNTARAAVGLAKATRAAMHVGGSTGSEIAHQVLTSEGWLGTSLAEVASHADLIVTLGDGLLAEAPLLPRRFLQPAVDERRAEWFHVSPNQRSSEEVGATRILNWPREQWYDRLTALLWDMQADASGHASSPDIHELSAVLQQSRSVVWLWDADEFCDAIDELTIRRLLGICRELSEKGRSALLCLDSNVGRVTAHETLLWLTGCHATARYEQQRWIRPLPPSDFALDDWESAFDSILVVQSVPSPSPLPNLNAAHFVVPDCSILNGQVDPLRITKAAAVGVQCAGHLFRGDRATMFACQADSASELLTNLPTAAEVLDAVRVRFEWEGSGHAD